MKKATSKKRRAVRTAPIPADEILPEYDFRDGRPNAYAARLAYDVVVVALDADVAAAFPTAAAVNDALRGLVSRRPKGARKRRSHRVANHR
jgi:hypothetical protein